MGAKNDDFTNDFTILQISTPARQSFLKKIVQKNLDSLLESSTICLWFLLSYQMSVGEVYRHQFHIQTINDKLKNITQIEHSRHRPFPNLIVNLIGGIAAYCLFPRKPMINLERVYSNLLTIF